MLFSNLKSRQKKNDIIISRVISSHMGPMYIETPSYRDERKQKKERSTLEKQEKFSKRNLIKEIKTWVIQLVRYSGPFLKGELKQMKHTTSKLKINHKASDPRYDSLYVLCRGKKEIHSEIELIIY